MSSEPLRTLLAVDAGLACGMACWTLDGELLWHESRHFPSLGVLRRATASFVARCPDLAWLVVEGGGPRALPWQQAATRHDAGFLLIAAEEWRYDLFSARERRPGTDFKKLARIRAGALLGTGERLDHNAAEAVLFGRWALDKLAGEKF
jgi:hypothetical protein